MSNSWTVESQFSERVNLSVPDQAWETPYGRTVNNDLSSNEGPQQLIYPVAGQQFIIYSAARSDNRKYCFGQPVLVGSDRVDNGCVLRPLDVSTCVGYIDLALDETGRYWALDRTFIPLDLRTLMEPVDLKLHHMIPLT
ncbi:hypothetical protein BJ878DRAFT_571219 [Calycina marina]|uniref:Uncharacterized protein n=1 Tax=Calycina marina TaxID=1763456 RepID=A0A9P7YUV0_9HELO|nr:hypothetical protein BJ878DRAFT_571219 [Calycina marina]